MGFHVARSATKPNHHACPMLHCLTAVKLPRTVSPYMGESKAAPDAPEVTGMDVFFNSFLSRLENAACTLAATAAGSDS